MSAKQSSAAQPPAQDWLRTFAPLGIACATTAAYLSTMHPGVGLADSAEIQWSSPLLGICHPPGYPVLVLCGKLFASLPIGPSVAWRLNLMMVVAGVCGAVLLYYALLRLGRGAWAALGGALILAFSGVYWKHSLLAEAYVFYAAFLIGGIYAFVRWLADGRTWGLYAAALLLGVAVGNRVSEAFVLPAFVSAWLVARPRPALRCRTGLVAALLFLAPYAASLGYFAWREDPRLLHARDDAQRDQLVLHAAPFRELSAAGKLRSAIEYSLALKWVGRAAEGAADERGTLLKRYGLMLIGFGSPSIERKPGEFEARRGCVIGAIALLFAAASIAALRRAPAQFALGSLMWLGNLAFVLWHITHDSLDFTIPGLIGLALLVSLGLDAVLRHVRWAALRAVLALAGPALLIVLNARAVNVAIPETREWQASVRRVLQSDLPPRAVVIARYDWAMTLRYLFHIEGGRTDVSIILGQGYLQLDDLAGLVEAYRGQGRPVFLWANDADERTRGQLAPRTDVALRVFGFLGPIRTRAAPASGPSP